MKSQTFCTRAASKEPLPIAQGFPFGLFWAQIPTLLHLFCLWHYGQPLAQLAVTGSICWFKIFSFLIFFPPNMLQLGTRWCRAWAGAPGGFSARVRAAVHPPSRSPRSSEGSGDKQTGK